MNIKNDIDGVFFDNNKMLGVSVVMSVFDNPDHVIRTIESVLAQSNVLLDFVIVDDGATEGVKSVLNSFSECQQIRVFQQPNQGLTKALIKGCFEAKYDLIARIDAGDIMQPNRLKKQADILIEQQSIGLVTSWVNVVTEEKYFLYDIKFDSDALMRAVISPDEEKLRTPFHASVMFRKSLYNKVGGYREQFYFAQDCDLWPRMVQDAGLFVVPEVLTIGVFNKRGISGLHLQEQRNLKSLVAQQNSLSEVDITLLKKAEKIRPSVDNLNCEANSRASDFSTMYFLARCLSKNKSQYAKKYWYRTIKLHPLSVKSWVNFFLSLFYRKNG